MFVYRCSPHSPALVGHRRRATPLPARIAMPSQQGRGAPPVVPSEPGSRPANLAAAHARPSSGMAHTRPCQATTAAGTPPPSPRASLWGASNHSSQPHTLVAAAACWPLRSALLVAASACRACARGARLPQVGRGIVLHWKGAERDPRAAPGASAAPGSCAGARAFLTGMWSTGRREPPTSHPSWDRVSHDRAPRAGAAT